jgi:magnesium-transporting ATPase (P-type)
LRQLRTRPEGLEDREAARRLLSYGRNELSRRRGRSWPRDLLSQFTHPLALLLWLAAGLSAVTGSDAVAGAIIAVIVLNAAFAFVQEQQAERAVELLSRFLPPRAKVVRGDRIRVIAAAELVPGDILVLAEGDRVSAERASCTGASRSTRRH